MKADFEFALRGSLEDGVEAPYGTLRTCIYVGMGLWDTVKELDHSQTSQNDIDDMTRGTVGYDSVHLREA
ncbi:hypothetical protein JX265_013239 [Neoarthrinium moseri]|uniref:Uncharacterized protein n=1 Tax=Neoarthrinium moseri TaxID=1658444 RepID=A0A9P9W9A6_9PEZI|nr:hypothetical protein JX265_013239 [Neoarthrinium moseri]